MRGPENPLEALERQLRAAGEDAAEVARVDAGLLAEPVARTVAVFDEVGEVVTVGEATFPKAQFRFARVHRVLRAQLKLKGGFLINSQGYPARKGA